MTSVRHLRALWGRYIAPGRLEREPTFRAVLGDATDRGLQVAGLFGVAAFVGAVASKIAAAALTGDSMLRAATDLSAVLADKLFIFSFAALFLVVRRFRPGVGVGRALVALYVATVGLELVSDHLLLPGGSYVSAWLSLLLLLTVGTVPFQPLQTALLGAALTVLPALPVLIGAGPYDMPGEIRRFVFLTLFTFVTTIMSASFYAGRYTQHRTTSRLARFRDRLERRGRLLEARSEELTASVERLSKAQTQLVQQEKMVSLGQLTAGVAHELKNPLNFINNFAELAAELTDEAIADFDAGRPDDARAVLPDVRDNVGRVQDHGRRADDIVRTMLVHARGVSGERVPVRLQDVVETAVEQAAGPAVEGLRAVRVETDIDAGLGGETVLGIPTALTRLVLNLVENAIHATRERAGFEGDGFEPLVRVSARCGHDRMGHEVALVSVEDNGAGISDVSLPRIFEPFYTTKAPGQGTGLGLSLAYDIAVGHGGSLAAGRAEAGGALFTVTLPLAREAEVAAAAKASAEAAEEVSAEA